LKDQDSDVELASDCAPRQDFAAWLVVFAFVLVNESGP
jgi:hypothetical protein